MRAASDILAFSGPIQKASSVDILLGNQPSFTTHMCAMTLWSSRGICDSLLKRSSAVARSVGAPHVVSSFRHVVRCDIYLSLDEFSDWTTPNRFRFSHESQYEPIFSPATQAVHAQSVRFF